MSMEDAIVKKDGQGKTVQYRTVPFLYIQLTPTLNHVNKLLNQVCYIFK